MARWRKSFEIVWHGDKPDGIEEIVRADMLDGLADLSKPSNLVFHAVLIGDDYDCPVVSVWGQDGDRRFHAEYVAKPQWASTADMEGYLP